MAIDPSVVLGLKTDPVVDPGAILGKAAQYRNLLSETAYRDQETKANQEKVKQAQLTTAKTLRDQQDQERVRQAFTQSNGDPDQTVSLAIKNGAGPDAIAGLQKHFADIAKTAAETEDKALPVKAAKNSQILDLTDQLLKTPLNQWSQVWPQFYERAVQIDPEAAKHFSPMEPPTPAQVQLTRSLHLTNDYVLKQEAEKRAQEAAAQNATAAADTHDAAAAELPAKKAKATTDIALANATLQNPNLLTPEQQQQAADRAATLAKQTPGVDVPFPAAVANQKAQIAQAGRAPSEAAQNTLDREAKQFGAGHAKSIEAATSQLEKIADARAMINGSAEAQALGIPKVLTALVGGQGTGVRITTPELNAIAKARGITGDAEGFINSVMGKGKLTDTQKQQLTGMLDDVKARLEQKRQIANDAVDHINSAKSRDEIVKIDKEARDKIAAMETSTAASKYKAGDTRTINGITYIRNDKGNWTRK